MRFNLVKGLVLFTLPTLVFADPGYYVSGELGSAIVSNGTRDLFNASNNPAGFAGRVAVGHLWGDNNLNYGLEAGGMYAPKAKLDLTSNRTLTYKSYAIDLLGVMKYTFNTGLSVFAKGGGAYLNQTAEVSRSSGKYDLSGSKIAPEVALGVGYRFNPQFEMNLTANTIFAGKVNNSNPTTTTSAVLLGLTYHIN